mmetsp:Transcript_19231/g.52822  ORF Transcript_19231/g.52822 Transcript_19231/m.52822 type:complete len:222 (+) Transcript_19231:835-1500(+)
MMASAAAGAPAAVHNTGGLSVMLPTAKQQLGLLRSPPRVAPSQGSTRRPCRPHVAAPRQRRSAPLRWRTAPARTRGSRQRNPQLRAGRRPERARSGTPRTVCGSVAASPPPRPTPPGTPRRERRPTPRAPPPALRSAGAIASPLRRTSVSCSRSAQHSPEPPGPPPRIPPPSPPARCVAPRTCASKRLRRRPFQQAQDANSARWPGGEPKPFASRRPWPRS